jgi:ribosomal protein S18 acetylase RimI-like enzyme
MPHETRIRRCEIADAVALSIVGQATFLETFADVLPGADILDHCVRQHSREIYEQWQRDGCALWLAEIAPGAAPIGYLVLGSAKLPIADPQPDDLEVKRLYLLHQFHGAGIGKRLMDRALQHARALGARRLLLGVYRNNEDAIAFYQRCGFEPAGTRSFQVGHHLYDDLIMARSIAVT